MPSSNLAPRKKPRIYLAGPMAGLEREEIDRVFGEYARRYTNAGFSVVNPAAWGADGLAYRDYLNAGCTEILSSVRGVSAVYLLPGWEGSKGARLEKLCAETINLPVYDAETGEPL